MGGGSGVGMAGPLAVFAPGFSAELLRRGYRPRSAGEQLRLMADASEWLAGHGVGPSDLTEVRVAELMVARRAAGRFHLLSVCAIAPLLEYLRGVGVVPVAVAASPVTPSEALIERYSAYLLQRRGLSSSTVRNYAGVARVFLSWREVTMGTLALGELDGAAVIAFVLGESRRGSVGSAKCLVTRLRAFLRFLHVEGDTCRELAGVVPSVASWRLAGLVKALDAGAVARLVASCDRRTRVGRRDFAVITLLSRLGLRAGEVAALRLADIDWRWRAVGSWQGQPGGASAAPRRCRRGARWLAVPRTPAVRVRVRVHQGPGSLGWPLVWWGVSDCAACVPSGRTTGGRRSPPQAHGRDRDAQGRRKPHRGRPGAASPKPGRHLDLRQG